MRFSQFYRWLPASKRRDDLTYSGYSQTPIYYTIEYNPLGKLVLCPPFISLIVGLTRTPTAPGRKAAEIGGDILKLVRFTKLLNRRYDNFFEHLGGVDLEVRLRTNCNLRFAGAPSFAT
jgi:hypothetical protein